MTHEYEDRKQPTARSAPEVVAPTSRVNVAFPFSNIRIAEPTQELVELAVVVAELVRIVERVAPGNDVERLRERAEVLAVRLR